MGPLPETIRLWLVVAITLYYDRAERERMGEETIRLWLVVAITLAMLFLLLGCTWVSLGLAAAGHEVPGLLTTLITTTLGYFLGIMASFFGLKP